MTDSDMSDELIEMVCELAGFDHPSVEDIAMIRAELEAGGVDA